MQEVRRPRQLHPEQGRFLESRALYRGFVGGRGSGKTFVGAYDMLARAKRGRTYLIGSPTAVLLNDTTFPTCKELAQDMGLWGPVTMELVPEVVLTPTGKAQVKMTPYPTVRLTIGAEVRFRTAEDPEKMRGPNLSGCWLDEASLMPREAFLINIGALREKREQGWLSATFTPKGLSHWTHEYFGDPRRPDTALFHAPTRANPFLPPNFAHTLRQQYGTGLRGQQELDGLFCNVEGAEWPPDYFTDDLWFRTWPDLPWVCKAMALDPSKGKDRHKPAEGREPDYSAYVWGAVAPDGTVWIDADLDNARDASRIVDDGIAHYRAFRPDAIVVETNQFQVLIGDLFIRKAAELRLPGLPLWGVVNTEQKELRIRTVGPYLAKRELRFRDTPGCRLLWQQLRDFPCGEFDDGPDALSMLLRILLVLILGPQQGQGQPQLLRA